MQKIVLASGNRKKLVELQSLLSGMTVEVVPQSDFQVVDAVEDGLSFVENALIKARHAAQCTGLPALADDSGIAVDFLQGQPGIHSARFAGEHGNDAANNQRLLDLLANAPESQRSAQFHCVLVFVRYHEDPVPVICHGIWHGSILSSPRGEGGFGYDPLFWVPTHQCSAAELPAAEKNRISHRGQAMQQLLSVLQQHYGIN